MDQQERHREVDLREYWQILVRRRWLIYTCVLVTTIAAAISSFLATPLYRSLCTISIERAGVRILDRDLTSSQPSWLDYQNFYNTQYRIIESDRVLRIAAEQLDLPNRPELAGEQSSGLSSSLSSVKSKLKGLISSSSSSGSERRDPLTPYVKMIRGGLTISPVRDSFLVELSFVSDDPGFAAEVANGVASAYRHFTLSEKMDVANQSSDWFVKQIGTLKADVNRLEYELQEYGGKNRIVLGDDGEVRRQNLTDLNDSFVKAQIKTAGMRARRDSIRKQNADSLEDVRNNGLIKELRTDLAGLEADYNELSTKYGPEYSEVKKKKSIIETKSARLKEEVQAIAGRVYQAAFSDYEQALREERELGVLLEKAKRELVVLDRAMVEYETKKVEMQQKRTTLQQMTSRQNDMTLSAALGDTAHNVRVIDFAEAPTGIYKPKKKMNILLGLLFGLFLGVGAAVLMEYIDNTIKSPEDVRNVIAAPVLGLIPSLESLSRNKESREESRQLTEIEPALITAKMPLSPVAEAYRELRTAVLLATPGHPPRDMMITSCQPSEGKTTTAVNLAIALSQLGRRVLLVDTDLRRPRCHEVLNTSSNQGVSNFLTGMDDLDALIVPTEVERLFLLPAGPVPPNPSELLDSKRFQELLDTLRSTSLSQCSGFDHLIFDSPPVLSVVDPLLIGRYTEGTVLVVRSAFTPRDAGRLGKEKLDSGRVNLMGVLLNAVQTEHVPYQYRYYRYGHSKRKPQQGGQRVDKKGRRAVAGGSGGA